MNKILLNITALALCFALTGCGDTGGSTTETTPAETKAAETTTTEKPAETTTTTTAAAETTTTTIETTTTVTETEPPVEEPKGPVLKKKDRYAIETIALDYLGTSQLYETEEYDENGNIINYIQYYTDHSGKPRLTVTYKNTYDISENLIETIIDFDSDMGDTYSWQYPYLTQYDYSEDNKLIKETVYIEDSKELSYYYVYEYDDSGKMTTKKEYDKNDKEYEDSRYTYKYDKNGNLIEEKKADFEMTTYEYDENNNLICMELKTKYADATEWSTMHSCKYEYDSSGNVTREYDNWNGMTPKVIDYEYDENNNVTFSREYNKIEEDYGYSKDYGYAEIDGNGYFYWDYTYENTYY